MQILRYYSNEPLAIYHYDHSKLFVVTLINYHYELSPTKIETIGDEGF